MTTNTTEPTPDAPARFDPAVAAQGGHPSIERWLLDTSADARLEQLITAYGIAAGRLATERQRAERLRAEAVAIDDALFAATEPERGAILERRAILLTELDAIDGQLTRAAAASARAHLAMLKAINDAARVEYDNVVDLLNPLILESGGLRNTLIRDGNKPKPDRMAPEQVAEIRARITAIGERMTPLTERQRVCKAAFNVAEHLASRYSTDVWRSGRVDLNSVLDRRTLDAAVERYAKRQVAA